VTAVASRAASPARPSLAARARDVLAFEWVKLRSIRSNRVTLLVAAIATIGSTAIVAYSVGHAPTPPPEGGGFTALTVSFLGYAEYAVIPVSVLAVLQFTSEFTTGLIRTTFTAVPRRWAVLAGKAAVTGGAALVAGEVLAFTCFFLTQALLSGRHRAVSLAQPGVP
jgi:ABC-2 type transport system permease protein